MTRRRFGQLSVGACIRGLVGLICLLVGLTGLAAQQPRRIGRLLVVDPCPPDNVFRPTDVLTQRLSERGWVQGQNFEFECVSAGGRLGDIDKLALELLGHHPELIVTQSTPAIRALIAAKVTIPVVMSAPDPVGEGYAASLARPGGVVTGTAELGLDLAAKRIELVREFVPHWANVAILYPAGGDVTFLKGLESQLDRAVDRFGIKWRLYAHNNRADDLEPLFRAMQQDGYDLLYLVAGPFTIGNRKLIGDLARKHGVRTLAEHPQFARDGALLSYGVDPNDVQRPMADRIDAILRGAKPGELPIEQMTKLHLVINVRTAREFSIDVPPDILVLADEVIE